MKQTVHTEKRVVEAVKALNVDANSLITLSNGVVLKATRVPNMIFLEITRRFDAPRVPKVFNPDMGREEENPADPTYLDAYAEYQASLSVAIVDAFILMGTDLVSVPDGIYSPSEDGWTRKLRIIGIVPGEDEMERYLMWVKYYAAASDTDINKISEVVGRMSGVAEEDVSEAVNQFRNIP